MQNKIVLGLVVVLIISLVGVYMAASGPKKLGQSLAEVTKRIDAEIQKISVKVPPYIYGGPAVGYVVEFENGAKFYFAGDTALTYDMKFVVGDYLKPDVAFLPIGNVYTMDAQAAAYAASVINPARYVVPTHYASCPLVDKTPDEFLAALKKYNLRAETVVFEAGKEKEIMGVKVLWLGHGNWLFTSPEGVRMLIDPAVEYNAAYLEKYKDLTQFERIDLILLTHGHFDHSTVPDLQKWVTLYKPIIIAPFELGLWLKDYLDTPTLSANVGANISKETWQKTTFAPEKYEKISNLRIHIVQAVHSSAATPVGLPAPIPLQYLK